MNPFILFASLYAGTMAMNYYDKKHTALDRALELVTTKGIINIGSGCDWSGGAMDICNLPEIVVNLDVHVADNCPKCQQVNLESGPLPFADRQFDVVLASHVLEHLSNWQGALAEWQRIADHVVVVLPNPYSINSYLNPLHLQHFTFADMISMKNSRVEVYA